MVSLPGGLSASGLSGIDALYRTVLKCSVIYLSLRKIGTIYRPPYLKFNRTYAQRNKWESRRKRRDMMKQACGLSVLPADTVIGFANETEIT